MLHMYDGTVDLPYDEGEDWKLVQSKSSGEWDVADLCGMDDSSDGEGHTLVAEEPTRSQLHDSNESQQSVLSGEWDSECTSGVAVASKVRASSAGPGVSTRERARAELKALFTQYGGPDIRGTENWLCHYPEHVDMKTSSYLSLLHWGCARRNVQLMEIALHHGADPNKMCDNETPLMRAARHGHIEAVRVLVKAGALVNLAHEDLGETPLMCAAASCERVVSFLLQYGANVNAANRWGETALIRASAKGMRECVVTLLEHGADPNFAALSGKTALWYAVNAWKQGLSTVQSLLEYGADPTVECLGTLLDQIRDETLHTLVKVHIIKMERQREAYRTFLLLYNYAPESAFAVLPPEMMAELNQWVGFVAVASVGEMDDERYRFKKNIY